MIGDESPGHTCSCMLANHHGIRKKCATRRRLVCTRPWATSKALADACREQYISLLPMATASIVAGHICVRIFAANGKSILVDCVAQLHDRVHFGWFFDFSSVPHAPPSFVLCANRRTWVDREHPKTFPLFHRRRRLLRCSPLYLHHVWLFAARSTSATCDYAHVLRQCSQAVSSHRRVRFAILIQRVFLAFYYVIAIGSAQHGKSSVVLDFSAVFTIYWVRLLSSVCSKCACVCEWQHMALYYIHLYW